MELKVRITLEDGKKMDVLLYQEVAPISVENFLKLVDAKYYDGIVFHRIINDFMAQAGGYLVEGNSLKEAKKTPSIKGEFKSNGVNNQLNHDLGVISMARTNIKDSASSQFFICTAKAPYLNGEYAAFGKVVGEESFKTLEYLNNVPTANVGGGLTDFPYPVVRIKEIRRIENDN